MEPLDLFKIEGNPSMVALLENLSQAGRIKTQTHTLAPDVDPAGLTAFLYLIHRPVKRPTLERLKSVRCIRELNEQHEPQPQGWSGRGQEVKTTVTGE